MSPTVWQIACGERGRRYEQVFFDYDVMLMGPGRFGAYAPALYASLSAADCSVASARSVRTFATEVAPGDIVLLRSSDRVVTCGLVDGDYFCAHDFDDVYGWDIRHCRRVLWQRQHQTAIAELQRDRPLIAGRRPTFSRVHDDDVLAPLSRLFGDTSPRKLRDMPATPAPIMKIERFSDALFQEGLSYDACLHVERAIRKLRGLLDWYDETRSPGRPTEHEVVGHMILPLLLALGWSEQLLAIEWNRIDLAVFTRTPTIEAHCGLVCEAKGMGEPLRDTVQQAKGYCDQHKLKECSKILIADGGYFSLYRRVRGAWEPEPSGYINLRKLRRRYLIPKDADAVRTLMALTPAHIAR